MNQVWVALIPNVSISRIWS